MVGFGVEGEVLDVSLVFEFEIFWNFGSSRFREVV